MLLVHYARAGTNVVVCSIRSYGQPSTTDATKVTCLRCLKRLPKILAHQARLREEAAAAVRAR